MYRQFCGICLCGIFSVGCNGSCAVTVRRRNSATSEFERGWGRGGEWGKEEQARLLSHAITKIMIVFVVNNYVINKNSVAIKRVWCTCATKLKEVSFGVTICFSQYT